MEFPTRSGSPGNETISVCISQPVPNPTVFEAAPKLTSGPPISVFKALPEVWTLIRPRRRLLALGFFLMVINRVTGLVLPASTKFLVDDVIGKHRVNLLMPLVGRCCSPPWSRD